MNYGEKLKKIRTDMGLNLSEMGRFFRTSHTHIKKWETGKNEPRISILDDIETIGEQAKRYFCDLNKKPFKTKTQGLERGEWIKNLRPYQVKTIKLIKERFKK